MVVIAELVVKESETRGAKTVVVVPSEIVVVEFQDASDETRLAVMT